MLQFRKRVAKNLSSAPACEDANFSIIGTKNNANHGNSRRTAMNTGSTGLVACNGQKIWNVVLLALPSFPLQLSALAPTESMLCCLLLFGVAIDLHAVIRKETSLS